MEPPFVAGISGGPLATADDGPPAGASRAGGDALLLLGNSWGSGAPIVTSGGLDPWCTNRPSPAVTITVTTPAIPAIFPRRVVLPPGVLRSGMRTSAGQAVMVGSSDRPGVPRSTSLTDAWERRGANGAYGLVVVHP